MRPVIGMELEVPARDLEQDLNLRVAVERRVPD